MVKPSRQNHPHSYFLPSVRPLIKALVLINNYAKFGGLIKEHLLYLGTGKTLMARQIGKMLNTREPKIISGPGKIFSLMFNIYTVFKHNVIVNSTCLLGIFYQCF